VQQNEIEPFIEFVVARPLSQYRKDGMAFRCKNPRRLQLWIQQNCGHQLYEVSAHEKYKIGRDSLRGHEPSDLKLSAPDIAILSEWASRRYKRYSFPTEFNRRIPRKALEKIKRVLTSDGEDVVIYMGLTSSEELPAEVTYDTLVRVVIPRDAMEDDFREQRALKVVAALRANLSACAGLSDHLKSGQRVSVQNRPTNAARDRCLFYPAAGGSGKSVLVRQLRGPHLSRWPWCSKRSSMALTAAASPNSLPQSSTGRLEVRMVLARS
jgi:hypothetical protein